jgi:polysaccharide pyruvyl transferase WcaK-like protein
MPSPSPGLGQLPDPILIVGGYGYRNTGDEAILASLLRSLEGRRVTVVSRLPAETVAMHGVRSVGLTGAVGELAHHRTLLIGGGGLFGRDMGAVGRLLPAFGLAASAFGTRVAIHGVGIDRGLPAITAVPLRQLARRASEVSVRDDASGELLAEWGVAAAVGPDLSSWLPPARATAGAALLRAVGLDPRRPIVALALTAVSPAMVDAVLEAAVETVEAFPEVQFCFVPMSQHPFVGRHNDLILGRRLRSRAPRVVLLEGTPHPALLLAVYGHFAAVVGMRYHSLVFAARTGAALVPVPYADKCRAWLAERGEDGIAADGQAWIDRLRTVLDGPAPARAGRVAS